jgi:hypothetical protein
MLRLPLIRLQQTHNVVYPTCIIKITWDEVGGRVGINHGRKAPYFTRHFEVFLHSFRGLALVPWFHLFQALSPTIHNCFARIVTHQTSLFCMNWFFNLPLQEKRYDTLIYCPTSLIGWMKSDSGWDPSRSAPMCTYRMPRSAHLAYVLLPQHCMV